MRDAILAALRVLVLTGSVVEVRTPKTTLKDAMGKTVTGVFSGYFDNLDLLAQCASELSASGACSVYFTLNPVHPDLLARASNHTRLVRDEPLTGDPNIIRRHWLLFDFDPVRVAGISSTDAEHQAALDRARACRDRLREELEFPEPVLADSGNGAHALFRIDLPNDDDSRQLIEQCLRAVALRLGDTVVQVDLSVFNAARICKVYGTWTRKGDNTPERPHRRSCLGHVPVEVQVVPRDLLERLAALVPTDPPRDRTQPSPSRTLDVAAWLAEHDVQVAREGPWGKGHKWVLRVCPWNPEHTNQSAYIVQFDTGGIAAGCHHAGCAGKEWHDLRDLVDPGWRSRSGLGDQRSPHGRDDHLNRPAVVLDSVRRETIEWVWHNRIARRKVNLMIGDPGVGKGFIGAAIAAALTTGRSLPDDVPQVRGDVLLFTAEDGLGDTVRPRVEAQLGDLARIHAFFGGFPLDSAGLAVIEREIQRVKPLLVVLDPFNAYAGAQTDLHRGNETRPIFSALAEIAERYNCAILVIHHMTKDEKSHPLYRASGSVDIAAACRSVLLAGCDPDHPEKRALIQIKNNLANFGSAIGYELKDNRLEWTGDTALTAAQIFGRPHIQRRAPARQGAEDFLRTALAGGPRRVKEIEAEADARGIARGTLKRAMSNLRIVATASWEKGHAGVRLWTWALPYDPAVDLDDQHVVWGAFDQVNPTGDPPAEPTEGGEAAAPGDFGHPNIWEVSIDDPWPEGRGNEN